MAKSLSVTRRWRPGPLLSALPYRVLGKSTTGRGQRVRSFGSIDVTVGVNRQTFTGSALVNPVCLFVGWDETDDAVLVYVSDTDAVPPAHVAGWAGLGVDRIHHVIGGDVEPADATVHVARPQVVAFLVEDLDAVVAAIGDPEATLGVEFQGVGGAELTVAYADLSPLHEAGAVGRELDNSRRRARCPSFFHRRITGHALTAVTIGDIDTAVGSDDDVIGLVKLVRPAARLPGGAEAHEQFTAGAELVDLLALGAGGVVGEVRDPHIAFVIHVDAVGRHHDAAAEVRQYLTSVAIKLEDWIDRVTVTVDWHATTKSARAATLVGPDVAIDGVDVDAGG